jgi:hypothetical protein
MNRYGLDETKSGDFDLQSEDNIKLYNVLSKKSYLISLLRDKSSKNSRI